MAIEQNTKLFFKYGTQAKYKALEAKENEKSYDGLITAGILVLTIGGIIVFVCLARKKNK